MFFRFFVIACIAILLSPTWAQQPVQPATPTLVKIGFVDLKKIFRDYQKVKQLQDAVRQETEMELAKIKGLKEEAKQLQEEIPLYKAGSKVRLQKEKKLAELMFDIKNREEKANHFLNQRHKTELENVYHEVAEEIENYARANGFFMIVRVSDADFFGSQSVEALYMQIYTRDVLYWQKENDITNIIIETINEKYKRESKAFGQ